jgi:hypothetical protein
MSTDRQWGANSILSGGNRIIVNNDARIVDGTLSKIRS